MKRSPLTLLDALDGLPAASVPLDAARARQLGSSTRPDDAFEKAVEALVVVMQQKNPDAQVIDALIGVIEDVTDSPGALSAERDPGIYFASGSNRIGEIRGLAAAGRALGVAANEVSPEAERELVKLKGKNIAVFVDSGAFGEVKINAPDKRGVLPFPGYSPFSFVPTKPITHEKWLKVLALYERLGRALGPFLYVVAPDQVGNQVKTARRLEKYAPQVRKLHAMGVNVIVPIQKGPLSATAFDRKIEKILGFADYVRGIPSKKKATSVAELRAFITYLRSRFETPRIHLLGKGLPYLKPREKAAYEAALVGCSVTADSVRIVAICGKGRALHSAKLQLRKERKIEAGNLPPDDYAEAIRRAFLADPRGASSVFEFSRVAPRIRVVACKLRENAGRPQIFLLP